MARTSVDEAIAQFKGARPEHTKEVGGNVAIMKAAKGATSYSAETKSARFVMTTQSVDRYGDVVMTEGIDTTTFETNPVLLLFHNSRDWPMGKWANLEKTLSKDVGKLEGDAVLHAKAPPPETDLGKRYLETEFMLENDAIRACSIGFIPDWEQMEIIRGEDDEWMGFRFGASELIECSICSVPANAEALVKSAGGLSLAKELVEDVLDNWQRSPQGVIMPKAAWERAYHMKAGPAPTVVAMKPGDVIPPEPKEKQTPPAAVDAVVIEVDTTDATEKLTTLEKVTERVAKAMERLFGVKTAPEPVAPPTAEEIEAVRQRAAEKLAALKAV